ncbi:MAG TPA: toprim domain-containing protein, partial [Burkholderiales bacterium]|nr:toprim domain-containing protein [Burkholderiales bacterium]
RERRRSGSVRERARQGTATSPTHVQKLLRQTDEVVFCFDGDAAGRKAAWHALEVSLSHLADYKAIRFLFLPSEHDPDSFVREEGREAFDKELDRARPLSEFFLDELKSRGGGTGTAEGRSRIVHEAKPLLKLVPAPTLQLQLLKSIAEAAGMTQEEAARLTEIRDPRIGTQPSARPVPAREERAPMQSMEVWLLKRLIVMPALAEQVPMDRIRADTLESRALHAFVEFGREGAGGNFDALLIDRFQGTEFEGLFKQIQKEAMVLNLTPEQVAGEFHDSLPTLERRHVKERLAVLQREAESRDLDAGERAALAALTRRLSELDRQRSVL